MSYEVTVNNDNSVNIALTSQAFEVTVTQLGDLPGGDMVAATYDPQDISADAFARANHTGTQVLSTISDAGTAAASDASDFVAVSALGSTVAELVSGTVPAGQLPSFVDDVEEYADFASLPATGEQGKIYIDLAEGDVYRWSGTAYVQINDAVSSADQATKLATARSIGLIGDATGSTNFDGSANVTISVTIADDSHNHIIGNIDGLQGALEGKVDDAQVLTNVPSGAVFSDTTYAVGDGGLTEINFTTARSNTLASATQPGDLGTAAASDASDFATSAQGGLADTAQQPPAEGPFVDGDKTKLDASATLTGPETLANKTLTDPAINVGSDATGDLYYRASDGSFERLPVGADDEVLTLASGLPSWAEGGGGGELVTASTSGATQEISFAENAIHMSTAVEPTVTFTFTNAANVARVDLIIDLVPDGFDLSTASYDNVNFDIGSQDSSPREIAFNSDGTKMFMLGSNSEEVHQYTLSSGFDLSTASYDNVSFGVFSEDDAPFGIAFNPDGTKMFMVGRSNGRVYQYTLSSGFDLSTASYDNIDFYVGSQDGFPSEIAFNSDGTKMFMVGSNSEEVHQYTLSSGFDLSTASYDNIDFYVGSQEGNPFGIAFNTDGTKMFIVGDSSKRVHQYTLSSGFDLSTASYDNVNLIVNSQDTVPVGIAFSTDGTKMFILGFSNDNVYQYTSGSFPVLSFPTMQSPAIPISSGKTSMTIVTTDSGATYQVINVQGGIQ